MKPVTVIMREITARTATAYGRNISFLGGEWDDIADKRKTWGKSRKTAGMKFPIICLYSPFTEDRTGRQPKVSLSLLIAVNTLKDMTNEEREKVSFEGVLRPIYREFIRQVSLAHDMVEPPYGRGASVPHRYTENYRYGRKGVSSGDGTPFCDYIDTIEITDLEITVKNKECYAKRL